MLQRKNTGLETSKCFLSLMFVANEVCDFAHAANDLAVLSFVFVFYKIKWLVDRINTV